ncbi:MAG TPA: NAD-dependent epimerase/dehydratase family protein [Candidatus Paceibacterota bacterium]|nr:NAD-dependent epimerase/dehydratase family protein [Candidatus Paceibacterota bacterium]
MSTYLITGGAGFIGTNLAERLVRDGQTVVVVDDLSAGKAERLPKEVDFRKLDICDTATLTAVMKGVDVVVHLAALPRVQFSIEHPFEAQHVNVDGTLSVLEAARQAGVKRVVYAASSSAYGDQENLPLSEDLPPQPKSPYGLHKYYGEVLMKLWHDIHGLETVSLRFFNVYGPHFDPEGAYALVIGKFLKQLKEGKPMTVTGDGEQSRDFTHVFDTVDAVVRATVSEQVGKGEVINVGAGRNVSINELTKMIGGPVEYVAPRIEPKHTRADNRRAKELLGWAPTIPLEEGVSSLKKEFGIA